MRIAHVVSTFPPYRGGQGNVARELAERTAARGHEVVVVTPRPMANGKWQMDNSYFVNYPLSIIHSRALARLGNAAWCPSIARTLEDLQPDVVHLHWPFIGGIAPVLAWRTHDPSPGNLSQFRAKLRKEGSTRRLVVQYHMDLIGEGWRGALFAAYQRRALPRVLAAADRVVVSSFDYARHGALAPFIKQLGNRLVEIPLGVDVERFASANVAEGFSPPRLDRGGLKAAATVLFVGGLDRAHVFKAVEVLLCAIAQVSGVRLRIVGDGDLRPAYEARAQSLRISDRVEFLGSVSDADLPGIYRNADVLVLPSTSRSEAFGVVLIEAMASSLPVIASDLPGVRTVVVDGETGFLVPPGDVAALAQRLTMLAQDPARARTMGTAARRRIEERYAWERVMDQWDACYSSL